MEIEFWKPILQFEGYEVSSSGKVRSLDRKIKRTNHKGTVHLKTYFGKLLKSKVNRNGYEEINLWIENKQYTLSVHRVVLETFKPLFGYGLEVNHKNGNRLDNRLENLEWMSKSDNHKHAYRVLGRVVPLTGKVSKHYQIINK